MAGRALIPFPEDIPTLAMLRLHAAVPASSAKPESGFRPGMPIRIIEDDGEQRTFGRWQDVTEH